VGEQCTICCVPARMGLVKFAGAQVVVDKRPGLYNRRPSNLLRFSHEFRAVSIGDQHLGEKPRTIFTAK
jgi:hypothetical protein